MEILDWSTGTRYVSAILKSIRQEMQLTQTEMAERLGVSFATINRWEREHNLPSPLAWQQILEWRDQLRIEYRNKGVVFKEDRPPKPATTLAARMDLALRHGGELTAIAAKLGTTVGRVRAHIESRQATGQWRFIPTAGRLLPEPSAKKST